jgi:hypothetical protein
MRELRPWFITLGVALAMAAAGCTHQQLRKNTVRQVGTVSDIYQQQVLDNLAKFVRDPHALPHFAVADSGSTWVDDSRSGTAGVGWNVFGFSSANLGFGGSRSDHQSWNLSPVSDPRKLELMRCAYQRTIASCLPGQSESAQCPNCVKILNKYYTGDPEKRPTDEFIVTSECLLPQCCWFQICCDKCLPKDRECCLIGHYCGVYVVVPPGDGQNRLSHLTLAILDYAMYKPRPERPRETKHVVVYVDANGKLTNADNASRVITVTQGIEEADSTILKPYRLQGLKKGLQSPRTPEEEMRFLESEPDSRRSLPPPPRELDERPTSILEFRERMRAFTP